MSDIASRVKAIIVEKLGVDESEVTPEAILVQTRWTPWN
jgi:acyl carrier protein